MVIPNLILTALVAAAMATAAVSEKGQARIAKEMRQEILMLPYFDVFLKTSTFAWTATTLL